MYKYQVTKTGLQVKPYFQKAFAITGREEKHLCSKVVLKM